MLGDKKKTEKYVRIIMDRAYGSDFFAGDEDNGEQGSWFVLSALGLFSLAPGSPDYVMGSPVFKHVEIRRFDERGIELKPFHIVAKQTSKTNIHVNKVYLNGAAVIGSTVSDFDIQKGSFLQFVMGSDEECMLEEKSFKEASGSGDDAIDPNDISWKEKYLVLKGEIV
jgi:putative alpha-1,2-mannosidase